MSKALRIFLCTLLVADVIAAAAYLMLGPPNVKAPPDGLMLAERCTAVDVQLTAEQVALLELNGPLVIPFSLDEAKVDPKTVCMDDAFVRVSIDGKEVVKIERRAESADSPAPPIHPSATLTVRW